MTDQFNLDELRVYSQLQESINYVNVNGSLYACISGYIVPYNVSCALLLWNITNSGIYGGIFDDTELYKTIIELNVNFDPSIANFESYGIKRLLNKKIYKIIESWTPDDFSTVIDNLYQNIQPIS